MTLAEVRNAFLEMRDDENSARFFKLWMLVGPLKKARLVEMCHEVLKEMNPKGSQWDRLGKMKKIEIARNLAYLLKHQNGGNHA